MALANRIKSRRKSLSMTQGDLAERSGVSYGSIQNYERGQIPKGDNLLNIARALECGMEWLIAGESPSSEAASPRLLPIGEVRQQNPVYIEVIKGEKITAPLPDLDPQTIVSIPKIEAKLSPDSDFLVSGDHIIGYYFFRKDWLKTMGAAKDLVLLNIVGDSMEPTLAEGDTVMIDLARVSITGGNIYAIGEGETILIKRIQPLVGGKIQILCDNRAIYQPQEIDLSKHPIRIIGQVVWMSKKLI